MPPPPTPPGADFRIASIELDEDTIIWRNADIEQERRVAIFDLIEENTFKPLRAAERGALGPYDLTLAVQDGRLALTIAQEGGEVGFGILRELHVGGAEGAGQRGGNVSFRAGGRVV